MKILHFTDSFRAGGKERQLVQLLKGFAERKDILCEVAIMSEDIHYTAVNEMYIKIHYLIRKNKKDPKILLKLYNLCKKIGPDIIHSWNSMTSVYAAPIARILNIKFVNGMIRDAPPKLKFFGKAYIRSKLTFPFSDAIVSNSFAGIKAYKAPLHKAVCIHNGFDFDRIKKLKDKETIKAEFKITTDKVVGMVASFSDNKDYETYVSSAQIILKKRGDVTFLAVGDGKNLDKCKKLVKLQFQDRIRFLGKKQCVEPIINIFNIGILSTYTEGISNSVMEYMALGKPVVATDCGGTKELVLDGETGFLVETEDSRMLSRTIAQLLDDNELSKKMGMAGKDRIKRDFNLEKMSTSFCNLYQRLLGNYGN